MLTLSFAKPYQVNQKSKVNFLNYKNKLNASLIAKKNNFKIY